MRKRIAQYGTHGRSVKVFVETFKGADRQTLVRVQWRENGKLRTESLPDSRDHQTKAKAFASGVAERLALKGPETRERITLRELGIRSVSYTHLRAHETPE